MKKLLFIFALCFCGTLVFADNDNNGNSGSDKETTRLEMQITSVLTPAQPDQMRSLTWYAEAWIDYTMNCIEIETNQIIGKADVVILDLSTGRAVSSTTIDPAYTTVAWLPLPGEGMYRMTITAAKYVGESNFTIE